MLIKVLKYKFEYTYEKILHMLHMRYADLFATYVTYEVCRFVCEIIYVVTMYFTRNNNKITQSTNIKNSVEEMLGL
jgi:hypothetical protein